MKHIPFLNSIYPAGIYSLKLNNETIGALWNLLKIINKDLNRFLNIVKCFYY